MTAWLALFLSFSSTPTQADISDRLTPAEVKTYTFDMSITTTHERSHILNHNASSYGEMQAIYLGKGSYLKLPWLTKVKLSDVAARVPEDKRHFRYKAYLVEQGPDRWQLINGQRIWVRGRENNPLYVLDEYQSYIHGANTGLEEAENGIYPTKQTDLFLAPKEMLPYVEALIKAIQDLEPEYLVKHPELLEYVKKSSREVRTIYTKSQSNPRLKW